MDRYLIDKIARHVHWARTQGVGRLIEEDQLDPRARARTAWDKARWRRAQGGKPGEATAVFLVGLQRSGTNMVVRGLEMAPEFEVHNENDRRAFDRFELRDLATVRDIVQRSRHRFVLFKPLCDSHRVNELLDDLGTTGARRAVWVYRDVDGRVRSSLAKFGTANLDVLRAIAAGGARDCWQAQRLSPEMLDLIASFDYDTLSAESAAALFWYLRNQLFFDQGLQYRDDVMLVGYNALVESPEPEMRRMCEFLGFPYEPRLAAHVDGRASGRPPLDLHPHVRELCTGLRARLDAAAAAATV